MGMVWVAYRREPGEARRSLEDPELLEELLDSDDDVTSVDLDKAWHGIHWLLTGSAEPTLDVVSAAIFGGDPVGEDVGYGPGRLMDPGDVSAVAAVLSELDIPGLREHVDPAAMDEAGIYPRIWDEEDVFDTYLVPNLVSLRDFYRSAAQANQAVIQTLC